MAVVLEENLTPKRNCLSSAADPTAVGKIDGPNSDAECSSGARLLKQREICIRLVIG